MSNDPLANLPNPTAARNRASGAIKLHIAMLRKAAGNKFDEAKIQSDPGMMSMYAGDAEDIFAVARMMEEGNYGAAYEKVCNMDTAARDEIPNKVYKFLEENGD